jgi:hypothetical protein
LSISLDQKISQFKIKKKTNSQQQIQYLQTQLILLKQELNNLSDNTKKGQLKNKLVSIEN